MKNKLEITIELYDRKVAELTGKEAYEADGVPVKCMIDLDQIEAVRQCIKDETDDEICDKTCVIFFKSGERFVCYSHSYDQIVNFITQ